jgi:non-heme chloroperoxidase
MRWCKKMLRWCTVLLLAGGGIAHARINAQYVLFTASDGTTLHYFDAGPKAGTPAIVLIPGWTMSADIFEPQLNGLQSRFRVVALDPRAQGDSEKVNDGNTLERRAQDTQDLIDHLHLTDVVLVGWSNGVPDVITYVELKGTAQLHGIVLVDGFVKMDNDAVRTALHGMLKNFQADRVKFTDGFVRSMFAKKPSEEYIKHVEAQAMKTPTNTAVVDMYNVMTKGDFLPGLAKMEKPVLYICEERLAEQGKLLQAALPAAKVEVMKGVGHALFVDDAKRFNDLLTEFANAKPAAPTAGNP